ncbi:helix-turn-helix domain-containing protein [Serratia fonticola]|uniref:helix-turn-helix domain-containing protein n=1 Tax=Serratia fonticola TaxID=47917 RepID=UPI001378BBB3|nr:helix-turn-helix transcriptional regulator [Serratia fonticola]NBJ34229.1 hypothetical protein [Serratia fonticola]
MIVVNDTNQYYKLGIESLLDNIIKTYMSLSSTRMAREPSIVLFAMDDFSSPHYCMINSYINSDAPTLFFTVRDKNNHVNFNSCMLESGVIYRNEPLSIVVEKIINVIEKHERKDFFLEGGYRKCNIPKLTLTEVNILRCIKAGLESKKIASFFKISTKTVSCHKTNAMKKLNITRKTELLIWLKQDKLDESFPLYCRFRYY